MAELALPRWRLRRPELLVVLGCVPLLWQAMRHFDALQWFGIALLPFLLGPDRTRQGGRLFLITAAVFTALHLTLGQYYWAFAAALAILYHLLHTRMGRLNVIAFYTLIFYLPLTRSFFTLFGFHVRIAITKWAGLLLAFFHGGVESMDSRLWVDGREFTVDPGCMGLRLVITGFILSLLIMQQVARRWGVRPVRWKVSAFLLLSLLLVILANFFRIVLTVQLRSPAGSVGHELIGLLTLAVFHLLPMLLLVRRFLPGNGHAEGAGPQREWKAWRDAGLLVAFVLAMAVREFMAPNTARFTGREGLVEQIPGYECMVSRDGVHKFANAEATLIVKPMFPLSFANHHPLLCWLADGYEVMGDGLGRLGEMPCYRATLVRADQQLRTAWWYADERGERTTSEWHWRWEALTGHKQYFLVNLAARDDDALLFLSARTANGERAFAVADR
ncbi:MAG: exosortase N [Flavobacteriales bacterium]|nr:exosortase N [Flavobacteriales bacterium]MCB9168699.1 exosortase N [Flavobacteriales bacterium]